MDANDFIKQHEDLKDIDVDNITKFIEEHKGILSLEESSLEGGKILKDCERLEKHFEIREKNKEKIAEKRVEEKESKLYRAGEALSCLKEFRNMAGWMESYENNESEWELINNFKTKTKELYENLGEIMLKFADGDKELVKKYL